MWRGSIAGAVHADIRTSVEASRSLLGIAVALTLREEGRESVHADISMFPSHALCTV